MQQAGERRLPARVRRGDSASGAMTRSLERNEDLLRLAPESGLGQLANETGGFLIRDTNDAAAAFRRIEEDMRFHYLLGYSPSNENYDGKFRSITVKVKRPGVQVQTRQGYIALRAPESVPLRSYEAPALALLDRQPRPSAFAVEAVALSFPTAKRPGPGAACWCACRQHRDLRGRPAGRAARRCTRRDFTVVARVKNASGQEVDRLSQHYSLRAPAENLAAARGGDVLFYREADLRPAATRWRRSPTTRWPQKAGIVTAALEVPAAAAGQARVSSLVLVGRAEKAAPGDTNSDNPLFFGDTILYPNMAAPSASRPPPTWASSSPCTARARAPASAPPSRSSRERGCWPRRAPSSGHATHRAVR